MIVEPRCRPPAAIRLPVKHSKVRRQIAWEAARLIREQPEMRHSDARRSAVERLYPLGIRQNDIPSDAEVGQQIRVLARADQPAEWNRRFVVYAELLHPLGSVMQSPQSHPEGDALYHSLQVFMLAGEELPYDEELLTAALLHDVGKAIDRKQPLAATLKALAGIVTERTLWFVEYLPVAKSHIIGSLGLRARRRLESAEDFDELSCLAMCDLAGRQNGMVVPEVEQAVAMLQELSDSLDDLSDAE